MSIMPSRRIVAVGLVLCLAAGLIWWLNRPKTKTGDTGTSGTAESQQDLFANSAQLQSFSVSPTTTAVITESLIEKRQLDSFDWSAGPKPYTAASLKTVGDDAATLKSYGLAIAKALKPLAVARDNETELLIAAFDNNDSASLLPIKSASTMFSDLAKSLLALPVPKSAVDRHLVVLNGARNCAWLLENMSQLNAQPVLAMESGRVYLEETHNFFLAVGLLGKFFNEQNITFTPDEKISVYVNVE